MKDILRTARKNKRGIITASRYVRGVANCLESPTNYFPDVTAEQWDTLVKESKSRLVCKGGGIGDVATGGAALSPNSIMDFDCRVTSTRKDRDGDVLESAGAVIGANIPLLWQHIPAQPIGVVISSFKSNSYVNARCAIANLQTDLAKDAATLVSMKALGISHGFEPLEYEPLKGKDGRWHIKKYEILEVSLVSVPSNPDGVIQAWSDGKLHSALIKSWAKNQFDKRQVRVAVGVDLKSATLEAKAGRRLSAESKSCCKEAHDCVSEIEKMEVPRACKALCREAKSHLERVMADDDKSVVVEVKEAPVTTEPVIESPPGPVKTVVVETVVAQPVQPIAFDAWQEQYEREQWNNVLG